MFFPLSLQNISLKDPNFDSWKEFLDFLEESKLVKCQVYNSEKFLNWFCKNTNTVQDISDMINQIMISNK